MSTDYHFEKKITGENFREEGFAVGEYERCVFTRCDFAGVKLDESVFIECEFVSCDLSNATVRSTNFRGAHFKSSKLLGVDMSVANAAMIDVCFDECKLDHASFIKLPLKKTEFTDCSLKRVFFSETDLAGAIFTNCDFSEAIFGRTNLSKADLSTSYNFIIDPLENTIKKAKFSAEGAIGLLHSFDIIIK